MQEENSSSQNVKLTILKIIGRGAKGGKSEIFLSDGSSFFVTQRMVCQNELGPGMFLSEQQIDLLRIRADYILAKKKALELLGRREHSINQLKQKLIIREFSQESIRKVIAELQAEGSLSNRRFVEGWLRYRIKKHPEGYSALLSGLAKAGITSGEAKELLDLFIEEIDMNELLERAAEKLMRKKNMTREKLLGALKTRGFDFSSIIQFIENHYDK